MAKWIALAFLAGPLMSVPVHAQSSNWLPPCAPSLRAAVQSTHIAKLATPELMLATAKDTSQAEASAPRLQSSNRSVGSNVYGLLQPRSSATSPRRPKPQCAPPEPPPSPPPPPQFVVEYRAFIPFDYVIANPALECFAPPFLHLYGVYSGDQQPGSLPITYRVSIYSLVNPGNIGTPIEAITPDVGISDQFDLTSPFNGQYLTATDYDGVFHDCHFQNDEKQAQFGVNGYQFATASSLTSSTVTAYYTGHLSIPFLSVNFLSIGWDLSTQIVESQDQTYGTVSVTGGVTCFPGHTVLVDSIPVATYIPPTNNPIFIAGCIVGPDTTPLIGPATLPGGFPIAN